MELENISTLRGTDSKTPTARILTGRWARRAIKDTGVVLDEERETVSADLDHIDLLLSLRE
jgi:hypothetical protein